MSSPPPPPRPPRRAATPLPTVPPPLGDEPSDTEPELKRITDRIGWVKVLLALVAAVFGGGVALAAYVDRFATRAEVELHRATAESAFAEARTERQKLRETDIATQRDLEWIKGALYQIAQRTGANAVPPPPP
jgi:hypothetical protein